MPLRYDSDDGIIEIVVDPNFQGDLLELAKKRIVYIVDTPQNAQAIANYRLFAAEWSLCEVNRSTATDPCDREGNLMKALQLSDLHYYPYPGFVVHGIGVSASLAHALGEKGVSVTAITTDGFTASIAEDAPKPGLWALTEFLAKEGKT